MEKEKVISDFKEDLEVLLKKYDAEMELVNNRDLHRGCIDNWVVEVSINNSSSGFVFELM